MKINLRNEIPSSRFCFFAVGLILLFINGIVNAQSISRIQNMNFGVFVAFGNGGTISVLPDFTFSKTGDIVLTGTPSPASFDLNVDAGKTVQMFYDKYVTLVGQHGGRISLVLNDSSPTGDGSIVTGISPTRITLGGKLTIGPYNINQVGVYDGSVQVKFIIIY